MNFSSLLSVPENLQLDGRDAAQSFTREVVQGLVITGLRRRELMPSVTQPRYNTVAGTIAVQGCGLKLDLSIKTPHLANHPNRWGAGFGVFSDTLPRPEHFPSS